MINQTSLQFKFNQKAVISLILGIISTGSILLLYSVVLGVARLGLMGASQQIGIFLTGLFFVSLISAVLGLILGIMSLKSAKKNFAIAGIVLSIIGILIPLFYFFF